MQLNQALVTKNRYWFVLLRLVLLVFLAVWFLGSPLGEDQADIEYRGAVLSHVHEPGTGYGTDHYKTTYPHLKQIGFDSVQINTFAFMNHRRYTEILADGDPTMSSENIEAEILKLKKAGFKVMLKPHVWIAWWNFDSENWNKLDSHQDPRNDIEFKNPVKREEWFSNYTEFILSQAMLAERTGVDILVVGTELEQMSRYTSYWEDIISKVREVYRGKLTYSAQNYNAFKIKFWDKLDYIGMDAYFGVARGEATVRNFLKGWSRIEPRISRLSKKYDKKVIFTEVGYKSVEGTTKNPWKWEKTGSVSQLEQAHAFEAFKAAFMNKAYLEGIFVWKYYANFDEYKKDYIERDFTPYDKKAEIVLTQWFESLNDG